MPSSYALGRYNEDWIKRQVESGRYNNASEVVRDALRHMQDREMNRSWAIEEIREAIKRSDASGPGIPGDQAFAEIESYLDELDRQDLRDAAE